jgi:hypothetical protein
VVVYGEKNVFFPVDIHEELVHDMEEIQKYA